MPDFVGALDQGTTSTRFIVFNRSGQIVTIAQKEHQQIYPNRDGWSTTRTKSDTHPALHHQCEVGRLRSPS